ncbi:MAG TPA: hypothetical protein PKL14_05670 [Holophaga sp.]|nr:hypothetical protein [Holophaga sp.]
MRRLFLFSPLVFVLTLVACRRPEVEAFERKPLPIAVSFEVSPEYPRAEELAKEYAAALRARLATRVTVVPAGVPVPDESAEMRVTVTQVRTHGDPSPAAIGAATGVAVGALSLMAGNRDAVFDGFFWGLWAGTHASHLRHEDRRRLGFDPVSVSAVVRLSQKGIVEPLAEFGVGGGEVIDQMDSLRFSERDDEARIREEEAKAFARVVVARLQERFHWLPLAQPSYYVAPFQPVVSPVAQPAQEPAPVPTPDPSAH